MQRTYNTILSASTSVERQRERKGMELSCLSDSYKRVVWGGGRWTAICQGHCVQMLEKQCHVSLMGLLPMAGAGHLC